MTANGRQPVVTFLSRPGCHLCDEALEKLNAHPGIITEVINIESDDELHRRFLERIPVVMVDDRIVSELTFDPEALESALRD